MPATLPFGPQRPLRAVIDRLRSRLDRPASHESVRGLSGRVRRQGPRRSVPSEGAKREEEGENGVVLFVRKPGHGRPAVPLC